MGAEKLTNGFKRGFPPQWLERQSEPKIGKDEKGYFIYTISENTKVYFEEYYRFLEKTEQKCHEELVSLEAKISQTPSTRGESLAYYRARKIILDVLLKNIFSFYSDSSNLGVIMTPWCFGTVILEKVEIYKDRIARGEANDPNVGDFPFYVLGYIDEIYKNTLLELFEFPEKAFSVRWQYTELLKRYSKVLSNVTASLQSILFLAKNQNQDT